jgi:HK97 family phage portal protein
MAFWSRLFSAPNHDGVASADFTPGDPDGVTVEGEIDPETRSLPLVMPSPWSGWPAEWSTPQWSMTSRFNELIDVAWMCLDLNASVLSTMPVYRTRGGLIVDPVSWMSNPDPMIYTSWHEFAKQLFWDYQLGEAFVLPMATDAGGRPLRFRVIPPWLVNVEIRDGRRAYNIGALDVTDDMLHVRYKSTTDGARGIGALESAGARMLTAGVLARYVREVATTGGVPEMTLNTDMELSRDDAIDMQAQWVESRRQNMGAPPVLDNGIKLETHFSMPPRDMMMLEITQFTEARIAQLLGVPAPLVSLPSGDPLTYKNLISLFDFHDRASLRPKAASVMSALSFWALPRGQSVELNRDEYTRPSFEDRADAWVKLVAAGIVSTDEVRDAERLSQHGSMVGVEDGSGSSATTALSGGNLS